MRTITFIFVFIFSFNGFSQFEANEYGFILSHHLRTLESRKEFIGKYPEISSSVITGITRMYNDKQEYQTIKTITLSLDSMVLINLPEFNKFKYKIKYGASYNEYHIAEMEKIVIKNKFNLFLKNKETYCIILEYRSTIGMDLVQIPQSYVTFPNIIDPN